MQIIVGRITNMYNKFVGKTIKTIFDKKSNKFLTKEIIENLKEAEREIDKGKVIPAKVAFRELRDIYG